MLVDIPFINIVTIICISIIYDNHHLTTIRYILLIDKEIAVCQHYHKAYKNTIYMTPYCYEKVES